MKYCSHLKGCSHLKNKQGKPLYTLVVSSTNTSRPFVFIKTWEECVAFLTKKGVERDDDTFKIRVVEKVVSGDTDETRMAHLCLLCNEGGGEYCENIYVEAALYFS